MLLIYLSNVCACALMFGKVFSRDGQNLGGRENRSFDAAALNIFCPGLFYYDILHNYIALRHLFVRFKIAWTCGYLKKKKRTKI